MYNGVGAVRKNNSNEEVGFRNNVQDFLVEVELARAMALSRPFTSLGDAGLQSVV